MKAFLKFIACFLMMHAFCSYKGNYSGSPVSRKWEKTFEQFGEKIAKKNQMQLIMSGIQTIVEEKGEIQAWGLVDRRNMTIDQARPIIVGIGEVMWNMMSQSKELADFRKSEPLFEGPLTFDMMGFKVSYWDENIDRPLFPYLAQVKVVKGQIFYFYADPKTQALQEPIIETFEEALQKVKSNISKN